MAQFGNKVKLTILKGMEAIGQGASNLASNAQQRLQELNMENQRRELLNAFPLKAYELWQKGERLPQPLEEMLTELKEVDERLNLIRAQRFAKVEEKKQNPETASEESPAEETASEETEDAGEAPAEVPEETPVSEPEAREETDVPPEEGETGDNA